MASEWREITLGEFVRLQRGHDLTVEERKPGIYPVMGSAGQNGTHGEFIARGPGVVVGRSGASMGRVHFTLYDYWPHNTCLYVTDFLGNHPRFTFYLLSTLDLASYNSGSAQPSLNRNFVYNKTILVPHPNEQAEIAEFLGAIDDRIDNLRHTNFTLEAIVTALFKSWFVDFDGVQPHGMQESELGLIPKGWRVEEIGKLVRCVGGATPSTKDMTFWEGGAHHWATPKDLSGLSSPVLTTTERLITDAGVARISSGLLPAGTLLMSSRAPIGYLAISAVSITINQGFVAIPPGGALSPSWLLFWAKENMEAIKQKANGSTFMEISKAAFRPIKVVTPPPDVLAHFDEVAAPVLERIKNNERHIASLAALRDTLLPRLVSGKLRVGATNADGPEVD